MAPKCTCPPAVTWLASATPPRCNVTLMGTAHEGGDEHGEHDHHDHDAKSKSGVRCVYSGLSPILTAVTITITILSSSNFYCT